MKRKVLLAVDSFKDSISGGRVCQIISDFFKNSKEIKQKFEVLTTSVELSDGGEGFLSALKNANPSLNQKHLNVYGPLGKSTMVNAPFLIQENKNTAILEMAASSGLYMLKKDQRNPFNTTAHGLGQQISLIYKNFNINKFIIGVGGSCTNDAGISALYGTGCVDIEFDERIRQSDIEQQDYITGKFLEFIRKIKVNKENFFLDKVDITIACDVKTPLSKCSEIFGPQKGLLNKDLEY